MGKLRNFFTKKKDLPEPDKKISIVAPSLTGRPQSLPYEFSTYMTDGFKGNDLVYACMKEKAEAIKRAPLKLYDKDGVEIENPLRDLLSRPNPFKTEEQILEKIQYHLDSAGNAYVHKVRSRAGLPVQLWNRNPDKVRPVPDEWEFIKGWDIKVGNTWYRVPPEDIIWFSYSDPENDFFGFPPLAAAALRVDIDNELSKYIKHILANMAVATGIFTTEETSSPEVYERNRKELMEIYSGAVNAGAAFYVEGGVTYKKIGMGLKELDFGTLWPEVATRIMSAFQVPAIVIGAKFGLEHSSYANYREAKKSFYDETIEPLWEMIAGVLEHALFEDFNLNIGEHNLKFDTSGVTALMEDVDKKYDRQDKAKDISLINERRALIGQEPIEGGNVIYLPMNMLPVISGGKTSEKGIKETKEIKKKLNDEVVVRILHQAQDVYYPLALKSMEKIFKMYDKEYTKVLNSLNIKAKLSGAKKEQLYDRIKKANEGLNDNIANELRGLNETVIKAVGSEFGPALGIDFDITNPWTQKFLDQYSMKFAEELGKTNLEKIKGIIKTADLEGLDVPTIAKNLKGEFADWSEARAMRVARTEIIRSTNSGARASYWQAGAKKLVWITQFDDRTCEWCHELDGKEVGIEEDFFKLGEDFTVGSGETEKTMKLDYEDVENPPLHPNCRCSIGAIF